MSVDPLAEKMSEWSPYNYTLNNPIIYIDPDGNKPTPAEAARMSAHVYGDTNDDILIGGWTVSSRVTGISYSNESSGFKSNLYQRSTKDGNIEYAYVTAGTEDIEKDGLASVKNLLGLSEQYKQSTNNSKKLVENLDGAELTFTGHSLGGGLATANSIATGEEAMTFNTSGVGLATWISNSESVLSFLKAPSNITDFKMITDPLSAVQTASAFLPGGIGKTKLIIPKTWPSVYNGHSILNVVDSLPEKQK